MYGVTSPSEGGSAAGEDTRVLPGTVPGLRRIRAQGVLRCRFARQPRGTEAMELRESGGFRIRFPRNHAGPDAACEAVMINTGGGMTGGDSLAVTLALDPGARAVATTQSAEKLYRAEGDPTRLDVVMGLGSRSELAWLPQEQILFSGARLVRRFACDMPDDATLTLAETFVFGRIAMGEKLGDGLVDDRWRIRRGGRLLYAETTRLDGALHPLLQRPALGGGARAVATVLHVAPDAESRLDAARAALADAVSDCGASAWSGMLVLRFAAAEPACLRSDLARFLNRFRAVPLPRVWQC
jgi:urease accessory protein